MATLDRVALDAEARRLSASHRVEWDALWRAIDARRRQDGTLTPWNPLTVRQYIEFLRQDALMSRDWVDRVTAAALLPSLMVLTMTGR